MRKEGGVCFKGVHMGMMGKDESDHTHPLFHSTLIQLITLNPMVCVNKFKILIVGLNTEVPP